MNLSRNTEDQPPLGWQPKSGFFQSVMAGRKFKLENPRLTMRCPCCGEEVVMKINFVMTSGK